MKKKKLKQTNANAHLVQYRFKIREGNRGKKRVASLVSVVSKLLNIIPTLSCDVLHSLQCTSDFELRYLHGQCLPDLPA